MNEKIEQQKIQKEGENRNPTRAGYLPVIYWTDDQKKAFNKDKQVLIGLSGTGKTLLITYKAAELLSENKTVVIWTSDNNAVRFIEIFKDFMEHN